jgi:hypothetical protein
MRMRRWRKWARVLALGVCAMAAMPSVAVRGEQVQRHLPGGARLIKIGPQAVVIKYPNGRVSMYDDPSQQSRTCKSTLSCMGPALQIMGVFGVMVYEDLTESIDVAGASTSQPVEGLP